MNNSQKIKVSIAAAILTIGVYAGAVTQEQTVEAQDQVSSTKRPQPWPIGEPTDEEKFWHLEQSPLHLEAKAMYWFPVRGGRLFTLFYQDASTSIAPTLTFVPEPSLGKK